MRRYFFIEDSLANLKTIAKELEAKNIVAPQLHVLSWDDAGVQEHHLYEVHSLLKKDVVHSGEVGALIGLAVAVISVIIAYFTPLPEIIGWVPFVFLSVVLLGFFTWEGGLFGIQVPNSRFRQFENALKSGKHIFFVDVEPEQEAALKQTLAEHPHLQPAGTGMPAPRWLVMGQQKWRNFLRWAP
jgi:hypothetical protein